MVFVYPASMLDEEFNKQRASLVRDLASRADPFIKKRLLALVSRYETTRTRPPLVLLNGQDRSRRQNEDGVQADDFRRIDAAGWQHPTSTRTLAGFRAGLIIQVALLSAVGIDSENCFSSSPTGSGRPK